MRPVDHSGRCHELVREFSSNLREVDAFCLEVRELLIGMKLSSEVFPVEMLLRESLNNAIIHGNCGDCRKKVRAGVRVGRKWIVMQVEDEGDGFDCGRPRNVETDPGATCGRGLVIYSLYAYRVSFNSKGNRVLLWRAVTGVNKS